MGHLAAVIEALIKEVLRHCEGALARPQAAVIAFADSDGAPLDPEQVDDAAVILRSEALIKNGLGVRQALARAREEMEANGRLRRRPPATDDAFVYCPVCQADKRFVVEAGLAYPRCGHRPLALKRTGTEKTTEP